MGLTSPAAGWTGGKKPISGINVSMERVQKSREQGAASGLVAVALCAVHHSHLLAASVEDPQTFSE